MEKNWKLSSTITVAAILIVGCGINENDVKPVNGNQGDTETGYEKESGGDLGEGEGEMDISQEKLTVQLTAKENSDMKYEFKLVNETDQEIELSFASLQEFDFIIKDQGGNKVYQYSDDKAFGESMVQTTVAPNEAHIMEIDLKEAFESLESGSYILEVWSVPSETDKLRTEIEISYSDINASRVETKEGYFVGMIDNNSVGKSVV